MSTQLPVTLYRGASIAFTVNLTDLASGLPKDVTPYTEIEADVVGTSACVTSLFSMSQIDKVSPFQGGQILVKFTSSQTELMALTNADPSNPVYTALTVKLTDATNPNENPYVIVFPGVFNIIDSPC